MIKTPTGQGAKSTTEAPPKPTDISRREAMSAVGKYALLAASSSTVVLSADDALAMTGLNCSAIPANKQNGIDYCLNGDPDPLNWPEWFENLARKLGLSI